MFHQMKNWKVRQQIVMHTSHGKLKGIFSSPKDHILMFQMTEISKVLILLHMFHNLFILENKLYVYYI